MKIALIIPCTSKNRSWTNIKESYLFNLTFKTFLLSQDKEHEYHFYLGIDNDDTLFNNLEQQQIILNFSTVFTNVHSHFIIFNNIPKGYLTKMWNQLFLKAYNDGCNYFYQCGDDITFHTKGWVNDSIKMLQQHNNVGLTGPINNNHTILTQAFVSRRHMEIFGYFFPENIINWCCDDWYNHVYKPDLFFPLHNHYCSNDGGNPRYEIDNNPNFIDEIQKNVYELRKKTEIQGIHDRNKIVKFINK